MNSNDNNEKFIDTTNKCSFCNHEFSQSQLLFVGGLGDVKLCPNCLQLINTYYNSYIKIDNNSSVNHNISHKDLHFKYKPKDIYEFLDQYVIGQEATKKTLSVAIYNHYKRLVYKKYNVLSKNTEIDKSNILLLGPTGSGKTLLCKTIARMLDVPFVIADATSLTQSGYVGEDVESVLSKLYLASNQDIEKTERGIVFIDEIDKIGTKRGSTNITRDVSGEGVQQSLLKMLEGSIVSCSPTGGRIHPEQQLIQIDTSNILFICSGAFVGIEDVIRKRLGKKTVGFIKPTNNKNIDIDDNILSYVTHQDIRSFGMIPELIGRLPIISYTTKLDNEQLIQVLTKPKNAIIRQYIELMSLDGVKLTFDLRALNTIVDYAVKQDTGARGLRGIMEKIMEDVMFNTPNSNKKTIRITSRFVEKAINQYNKI